MRINKFVILFVVIAIMCVIFGCFLYKKENYSTINSSAYEYLVSNNFISPDGIPLNVTSEKYKQLRDFIKVQRQNLIKASKKTPDTPEEAEKKRKEREERKKKIEEEKKKKAEEDAWKNKKSKMTSDLVDVLKGSGLNAIKMTYGMLFNGDNTDWKEIGGTLAGTIGVGLLKIGLAACGLGFLSGPLDSIFFPEDGPPPVPPIDYEKIRGIVTDQLFLSKLNDIVLDFKTCTDYLDTTYSMQKIQYNISCDPLNSEEENSKCVSNPNYDPNIIKPANTSGIEKNKRALISNILKSNDCPLYKLLVTSNAFAFHEENMNKFSMKITAELFPSYINLIMMEISYYQERALYDDNLTDEKNYKNPWISNYLGTPSKIKFPQTSGTLLGQLQKRVITLFNMWKQINYRYCSNLVYVWPCTRCCTRACIGPQYKECRFYDNNDMVDSDTGHWIGVKDRSMGGTDSPHWEPPRWGGIWGQNPVYDAMYFLQEYFFQPYYKQIQDLKKMAGIEWLENEKWYSEMQSDGCPGWYADAIGRTPPEDKKNSIIYSPNGGYPFGLNKTSYSSAIYANINGPVSMDFQDLNGVNTLCTPVIYGEEECVKCGTREICSNKINKEIFNKVAGNKVLDKDVYCIDGGLQSCLQINKNPGNLDGTVKDDSRSLYCINKDRNVSKYYTFDGELTDESCNYNPTLQKCGTGGTPLPVLPPITVNSPEYNVRFIFTYKIPQTNPAKFGDKLFGTASCLLPTGNTVYINNIEIFSCNYLDKSVYVITPVFREIFNKLNLKNTYPYLQTFILLKASILDKPLSDPGMINQTTIPPINTDSEILGFDDLKVVSSMWINSLLEIRVKLRGVNV